MKVTGKMTNNTARANRSGKMVAPLRENIDKGFNLDSESIS